MPLQLTATTAPFNETVSPPETTVELVDVDSPEGTDVVEDDEEALVVVVVSFGFGPSKAYSPSRTALFPVAVSYGDGFPPQ